MDRLATPYSKIYDRFLSKIEDLKLINLPQNVAEKTMKGYLEVSSDNFTMCSKDLSKRNDVEFEENLSGFEMNILAEGMLYEWIQPYINNILLMKQHLPDKDFRTYSQANHLKELQSLRDSYEERMDRLIVQYTYENDD